VAGGALASGNTPVATGNDGTVTTQQAASKTTAQTIASIAAKVSPSVVQVEVETYQGQAIGSGVILSSDGKILTNAHVVSGASEGGTVKITFSDGKTANATVLGSDTSSDLAVLQAENVDGLKAATLGDSSSVQVGDEVVAIGSPEGLQGTVTSGIVSALGRDVTVGSENRQQDPTSPFGRTSSENSGTTTYKAIQTDASLNPGNSGGPLLNLNGEVIGINSAIYSPASASGQAGSVGLGFAIPINEAKEIITQLENGN
jgi:putative serine protease PepD